MNFEKIARTITGVSLIACGLVMFGMLAIASDGAQIIGFDKFAFGMLAGFVLATAGLVLGLFPTKEATEAATKFAIDASKPDRPVYH